MKPILTTYLTCIAMCCAFLSPIQASITLHCPADQTLNCTAETQNLDIYGNAYLMKNGIQYSAGLAHVVYNLSSCNVGTIKRTWTAEDADWNIITCTQTLRFTGGTFNSSNIRWPKSDTILIGCDNNAAQSDLLPEYKAPTYDYLHCSHIGISHTDETYVFGSDCRKLLRHWTVVDWCIYQPGVNNNGIWTYTQIFKITNDVVPNLACKNEIEVNPLECDSTYVSLNCAQASGASCTGSYHITNNSIYADTTTCDASGKYPLGNTMVTYKVEYGCGQEASCQTLIKVNRDVKPVPYCLATLNVVLMPVDSNQDGQVDDGMVEVWAKDLNVNSYHPCHNKPLTFSFESDALVMSRAFTCAEVGPNQINIYVTDHENKQAYCRVNVNVQNNGANIPDCAPSLDGVRVEGKVTDPMGQAITDVYVSHKDNQKLRITNTDGSINEMQYVSSVWTSSDGTFEATDLMPLRSFRVTAFKAGDASRVTQADIDLLESHIKKEITFQSPYTYLAADINIDGTVDIQDFHLLKNLRGAHEDAWPNQKQWAFYRKSKIDNMSANPLEDNIPEYIEMTELNYGMAPNLDFIGILKGDLDFYERM